MARDKHKKADRGEEKIGEAAPREGESEEKAGNSRKTAGEKKEPPEPLQAAAPESHTIFYLHSLLLLGGRILNKVLDAYSSLFDLTLQDKAKIYRNISTHYVNKNLPDKALYYLREWARMEPHNPEPPYQLGKALSLSGNYESAFRAFNKALKIRPDYEETIYRKSALHLRMKDYKEAIKGLEQVIKTSPDEARAHYLLGIAYDGAGQVDKAVQALQKASELDPGEIKYQQHLGFMYVRKEDHQKAAEHFSRVMELEREQEGEEDED